MEKEKVKNMSDQELEKEAESLKTPLERILDKETWRREINSELIRRSKEVLNNNQSK